MEEKAGCIFLSHSSDDKPFVEKVLAALPKSHVFYDKRNIEPGDLAVDKLKTALMETDVFVLFLSPDSMKRDWVRWETEVIEAVKIRRDYLQVLVIPIKGASYLDAPEWMRRFQLASADYKLGDLARLIWNHYLEIQKKKGSVTEKPFVGREELIRSIVLQHRARTQDTAKVPNFIHLVGFEQIGRHEVAKHLVHSVFPRSFSFPAYIELKAAADAIDLYLALKELLDPSRGLEELVQDREAFDGLEYKEKAEKIYELLRHFGVINQVVIIKSAMGLRDKSKAPKPWVQELLILMQADLDTYVIWISERRLPQDMTETHKNLMEMIIPPLSDNDTQYLLEELIGGSGGYSSSNLVEVARQLNGHPGSVYYVAKLITERGFSVDLLSDDKNVVAGFQNNFTKKLLATFPTASLEFAFLYILTAIPHCEYDFLSAIAKQLGFENGTRDCLEVLGDHCLIHYSSTTGYSSPQMVRSSFRYFLSKHPVEIVDAMKRVLKSGIAETSSRIAHLEMLIHVYAFLGSEIPSSLKRVVTGATVQELVEQSFQNALSTKGAEGIALFQRAAKFATIVETIDTSDDIREDVLLRGAEASRRSGVDPHHFIELMKKRGYPSAHLALGTYALHSLRDYHLAAKELKLSFDANCFRRRSARALCQAYLALRKPKEVLEVLEVFPKAAVEKDSSLLTQKVKALSRLGRHEEVMSIKEKLAQLPDDFGNRELQKITDAIKTRQNLEEALESCRRYREKPKSNKLNVSFLEATIHIELGQFVEAEEGIHLAKSTGRMSDYFSLVARRSLATNDVSEALKSYLQINKPNLYDKILAIRIFEAALTSEKFRGHWKEYKTKKDAILAEIRDEPDNITH